MSIALYSFTRYLKIEIQLGSAVLLRFENLLKMVRAVLESNKAYRMGLKWIQTILISVQLVD
jgi:hypothetical protein